MASHSSSVQRAQLAQTIRKRLVTDAGRLMVELGVLVQNRLTDLMNEVTTSREMQNRRDAWNFYQRKHRAWVEGTQREWQQALNPAPTTLSFGGLEGGLELVGTEVVENKIITSRLVLGVMDGIGPEVNDLRIRINFLDGTDDFAATDILRPELLLLTLVEQWADVGMPRHTWATINDAALKLLTPGLKKCYAACNAVLINQGVLPVIDLRDRVKRSPAGPTRGHAAGAEPDQGFASSSQSEQLRASLSGGWPADVGGAARNTGSSAVPVGPTSGGALVRHPGGRSSGHSSGYGLSPEETRMMTGATPLARARSRAQGLIGQLKRLLIGSGADNFNSTAHQLPSSALAAALAPPIRGAESAFGGGTLMLDYSSAGVQRLAGELRQQTSELKNKAETKSEKATIEIVALMFQAILQEERIPPTIRVWFARLQMPVLRVAMAEPDFFGTLNHPARQLIDRMGSCVMGFDASGIRGSELEAEIKRVVQVIEQYPETGKRVYELVYDEFKKFLAQFLTGRAAMQKVVNVAQQVEQKETLTIQYTIEMRKVLKDVPVRDEVREFLFKTWAEVLAVAAVRKGPQHAETLELKKAATDLVWAVSAKPNRSDRARVIKDLPALLQLLRSGMTTLGVRPTEQDAHIKVVSDTLADAFLSKTMAIPVEQIQFMAERLANLEDFVSNDGMNELPLDAQGIELMLGIDASTIDVVTDGGSKPTAAMRAWAEELLLGAWFTLDHNGRVAQVQYAWRSDRKHLNLFASTDGHSYLFQTGRLAAYLQAGLLLPQEEETLTVRATRDALVKLEANPERLLS